MDLKNEGRLDIDMFLSTLSGQGVCKSFSFNLKSNSLVMPYYRRRIIRRRPIIRRVRRYRRRF